MAFDFEGDVFAGLSGLKLGEARIALPRGMVLEGTFAHVMSPITVAFAPPGPEGWHPAPWKAARGGFGQDITAQIRIPKGAADTNPERLALAFTVLFLIRLWSTPAVTMPAVANMSFHEIASAPDAAAFIATIEHKPKSFALSPVDDSQIISSISWVADHFESAYLLSETSAEFRLAVAAMESGQFIENTALTMISLWGALEAIFSPSTSELRFRVSALIASYLHPMGQLRLSEQKRIAVLYDKRSAAAHGKPKHEGGDLLATFHLLRAVLIRIIRDGRVPDRETLEARMFGAPVS